MNKSGFSSKSRMFNVLSPAKVSNEVNVPLVVSKSKLPSVVSYVLNKSDVINVLTLSSISEKDNEIK